MNRKQALRDAIETTLQRNADIALSGDPSYGGLGVSVQTLRDLMKACANQLAQNITLMQEEETL